MKQEYLYQKYQKYRSKYLNLKAGQGGGIQNFQDLLACLNEKETFQEQYQILATYLIPKIKNITDNRGMIPANLEKQIYTQVYEDFNINKNKVDIREVISHDKVRDCYDMLDRLEKQNLEDKLKSLYGLIYDHKGESVENINKDTNFNTILLCFLCLFWTFNICDEGFSGVNMIKYRESETIQPNIQMFN